MNTIDFYENLKFGIGVIDMARERYLLNDEEETIHRNQIVPTTGKEKRQNWWFHHKVHLIATVLVIACLISIVYSVASKEKPDYTVTLMTEYTVPSDLQTDLEEHLEKYAEDLNGDGKVVVALQYCRFYAGSSSEYEVSELQASFVKFAADASEGDTMLFIYDQQSYDYLDQNEMDGFFGPAHEGEEENHCLWADMEGLKALELNHYKEEGVTAEGVQNIMGSLKVSVRTEDADANAFKDSEKIEYRKECVELYDRLMNNEQINTEETAE